MRVKKRYFLQKKKLKKILGELGDYSVLIPPKAKVEMLEADPHPLLLVNDEPSVILIEGKPFPTLKGVLNLDLSRNFVVVDRGAVKFMAKGANVMSPGIVDADPNIKEGDTVVIIDETHHKPLAIGISIKSGVKMVQDSQGKAVKTIHYIGDKIWEY